MAVEAGGDEAALAFLRRAMVRECLTVAPDAPEPLWDEQPLSELIASLCFGLPAEAARLHATDERAAGFQLITAGWTGLEGVMLLQPEPEFRADLRACVTATTERALRDLLRAFLPGRLGFFYLGGEWMLPALAEFFDGRVLPATHRSIYRVPLFLGIKRGSGAFYDVPDRRLFSDIPPAESPVEIKPPADGARIAGSKDPVLTQFRELGHGAGRRARSQFVVEGARLVQRAIQDGLPVDAVLFTPELPRTLEGDALLRAAREGHVQHYSLTEGLMGKVTTTRPVPPVVAAVFAAAREVDSLPLLRAGALLMVEQVDNPDNLGMVLRTADAAGVDGVIVIGEKTDPFHKNCVRAARGAVGRLPLFACRDPEAYLGRLREGGFRVVGGTAHAASELFRCAVPPPFAVVVGNEHAGISPSVLAACTDRVRIPMAPGQDSLNVGVAAGILLYELLRQRRGAPIRASGADGHDPQSR